MNSKANSLTRKKTKKQEYIYTDIYIYTHISMNQSEDSGKKKSVTEIETEREE